MSPEEVQAYAAILDGLGTLGVLVFVLFGLTTGRLVTRSHLEDVKAEQQEQIDLLREWLRREDVRGLDL